VFRHAETLHAQKTKGPPGCPDGPFFVLFLHLLAEEVGFEPTEGCPSHAFQACRFGRSRTPPEVFVLFYQPSKNIKDQMRLFRPAEETSVWNNTTTSVTSRVLLTNRVVGRGGWVLRRGILVNRVRAGTQQPSARRTGAVDNLAAAPGNPIFARRRESLRKKPDCLERRPVLTRSVVRA
jgi:hypothetical protein